jgi:acyl carrier protein
MKSKILSILNGARPESDFESSTNFVTDGLLDSLDIMVIIREIEVQFNVVIDGIDIVPENFNSLESILNLVNSSS